MLNIAQNLKKSIIPGLLLALTGLSLQVGKTLLILKGKPPEASFVIEAAICYFLMAFFFSFGFFVFYQVIPGKQRFEKAYRYTLFCFLCVGIPGLLGIIAFDFNGGTNLLTAVKIDDYVIAVTDFINLVIIGGAFLGLFSEKKTYQNEPLIVTSNLIWASIAGLVLYPTINFVLHQLINYLSPHDYQIPNQMIGFHYTVFYGLLFLTGMVMPVLYQVAARLIVKTRMNIPLTFTIFFFICLWLMNIAFLLPFGYSWNTTIKFWIENLISTGLVSFGIAGLLNYRSKSQIKWQAG